MDWVGSAAAVEVAGGAPEGLAVALEDGAAVEAVEGTAAAGDDVDVGGLAAVVDVLVVLLQPVIIMVAITTTLRSAKIVWRLRPACRAFFMNTQISFLPIKFLPPYFTSLKLCSVYFTCCQLTIGRFGYLLGYRIILPNLFTISKIPVNSSLVIAVFRH